MSAAPDLARPIVAFRAWRLSGGRLVSPFIPCRWDGRLMHAECYDANRTLTRGVGWLDEPHASPDPRCQCGIYGYFTPGTRSWFGEALWCEGVISVWGRVELHADGLRAEHARVEALALPAEHDRLGADAVRSAAAQLGVPVLEDRALEAFGESLGGAGVA